MLAIAWLASENRRAVPWRAVGAGLVLQLVLALLLLKLPFAKRAFLALNDAMLALEKATQAGTALVFGYLGGGAPPFAVTDPGSSFILAFRALPLVLVVSALSALLFYWRVLPAVVRAISWLLERTMRVGGVVGLATAANVFVGMVEAPLVVRPYLARVSRGELFAIMVGGMASIAGTVLLLYASILRSVLPDAVAHLLDRLDRVGPGGAGGGVPDGAARGRGDRRAAAPRIARPRAAWTRSPAGRSTARSC